MVLEMEVENAKADARVAADDSQECAAKLQALEEENKKKDATIVDLNKDLEQKIKTVEDTKKREKALNQEKVNLEKNISELKSKALAEKKAPNHANKEEEEKSEEAEAPKESKDKTNGKGKGNDKKGEKQGRGQAAAQEKKRSPPRRSSGKCRQTEIL